MSRSNFEKLRVYKLSETLADEIWNIVLDWNSFARETVGKQLVRSADSVGANIAEGAGRGTYADNRRFVRTARGSLNETRHWLRRAFRRKPLTAKQVDRYCGSASHPLRKCSTPHACDKTFLYKRGGDLVESSQQETNCSHLMKTSACALVLLLNLEVLSQNSNSLRPVQGFGVESANVAAAASAPIEEAAPQAAAQANPLPYLTNAVCVFDVDQGWTVRFSIQGGGEILSYGIYRASSLTESTVWELLGEGCSGSQYEFGHQPEGQAFYALGDLATGPQASSPVLQASSLSTSQGFAARAAAADVGAQAMSDSQRFANLPASWLAKHFGANWRNNPAARAAADPDGDGVSNLQEQRRGRNPLARAVPDSRDRAKLRVYTLLK